MSSASTISAEGNSSLSAAAATADPKIILIGLDNTGVFQLKKYFIIPFR